MDIAIRTADLTRHFGDVRAVEGLSLEVPTGIVFGFLGPNGSGKTTTIRLLLGLLEPTRGSAEVLGLDTVRHAGEIRALSGALLEYGGLYDRLSAYDNLQFYGRIYGLPAADREARIEGLLRDLDLWDRRHEPVVDWSRGMRQKLAVARALLHRPRLVFLDEPSAGLDPIAAAALRDDLAALVASEGVTVFLTTHNLAEAEKLCAQVGVIRQGRLLAVGDPDSLRERSGEPVVHVTGSGFGDEVLATLEQHPAVTSAEILNGRLVIHTTADADTAAINRLLVTAGAEVREVTRSRATLEDVFLTLMEEEEQE